MHGASATGDRSFSSLLIKCFDKRKRTLLHQKFTLTISIRYVFRLSGHIGRNPKEEVIKISNGNLVQQKRVGSVSGGVPSPIFPSDTLFSFPIHQLA
ncbi:MULTISPECIES: hypothetical protein [Nostocales]|uniref:Uncharacterized protein n=3 Tax=Nostocales TaxID=1161 RepID=A0A0C1N888_9CYAN|nr:hypothetical protein [Tolypothrix bouteillei]KAF3886888.1 hypothetical protein DA73_0400016390 [Tolypothrix bouteillei VB521301]